MRLKEWAQEKFGDDIEDLKKGVSLLRNWMAGKLETEVKEGDTEESCEDEMAEWITQEELDEIKSWYFDLANDVLLTIDIYIVYQELEKYKLEKEVFAFLKEYPELIKAISSYGLTMGIQAKLVNIEKRKIIKTFIEHSLKVTNLADYKKGSSRSIKAI